MTCKERARQALLKLATNDSREQTDSDLPARCLTTWQAINASRMIQARSRLHLVPLDGRKLLLKSERAESICNPEKVAGFSFLHASSALCTSNGSGFTPGLPKSWLFRNVYFTNLCARCFEPDGRWPSPHYQPQCCLIEEASYPPLN